MASKEQNGVLPLQTLALSAVPFTTHNIAWSPDAELAIGADDSVYLYLPEFPSDTTRSQPKSLADLETRRQYHVVALHFPIVELRVPKLNKPLFEAVRQDFPDFETTWAAGQSVVANIGSSLNHVVALEWSPDGLGRMKRSVLGVLTGSGALTIYCEGAMEDADGVKIKGRNIRIIGSWVTPWSVGGRMLLPRATYHQSPYSQEYITSFAWARDMDRRDLDRNMSLLAYMNDEDEIVILSVQSRHSTVARENSAGDWRVEEVARFAGDGPHGKIDQTDPDCMPAGSSFALRWSPWLQRTGSRTAILSYVTRNYVGFRQVSIKGVWREWKTPEVEVQSYDCSGTCIHLAPDAFVTWEDLVWTKGQSKECRGIIATPFTIRSFSVTFDGTVEAAVFTKHDTAVCGTSYPPPEQLEHASNPITGLVVHPPDISKSTESPSFSLCRLSATCTNTDWYQTNLPPRNTEGGMQKASWAADISELLDVTQPFPLAYRYHNPEDGASKSASEADDSGDEDESYDDSMEEDYDDEDDFERPNFDDGHGKATDVEEINGPFDSLERLHMSRVRIWGMAVSPGNGVTAVFATVYSTIRPERYTFGGLRCRVFFGQSLAAVDSKFFSTRKLSTEARVFEWMYGSGPPVPGVGKANTENTDVSKKRKAIKDAFKPAAEKAVCALCGAALEMRGTTSRCLKGHGFANCAATGLPILAPGISNNCGVCGAKSLKPDEIPANIGDAAAAAAKQISSELCGGCGGKFLNQ